MKLSTKIILPIILISALLILLNGCFLAPSEEQPALTLYTVTYNGNENTGGEVPVDTTLYKKGDLVTVLGNTGPESLVNTGFDFAGWNTVADASGTARPVGYVFAMGEADVTLYAMWDASPGATGEEDTGGGVYGGGYVAPPTYTVTYDGNDETSGTVPVDPVSYAEGASVTVLGNTGSLVKTGYTFNGWNALADGLGTARAAGSTFTMGTSDVTLYAKWQTYELTMAVSPGGSGTTTPSVGTLAYSAGTVVGIEASANACWEFDHWSGALTGDTNPNFILMDADKVVTANFVKITYTIEASAGTGGSISPSGDVIVDCGTDKTFTITPDSVFYEIADVEVDGSPVGPASTYEFLNVTEGHTIEATFTLLGRVHNQDQNKWYDTIQLAEDDASSGETLLVSAWTYPEDITVDVEGITIRGVSLASIVDGGFILKADNITIDGLTIKNGFSDRGILTRSATGPTWGSKGHQIINNEIFDVRYAINIVACGTESVNIVVDNNKIHDSRIAIMLEGYETIITNNEFYDNIKSGIEVERSCDNVISYNSIYNNGATGIRFGKVETNGNIVNYNNIYGNVTFGVLNDSEAISPIPVDAKDNWWGNASGPSGMGPGTGDAISVKVNYIPWSPSPH